MKISSSPNDAKLVRSDSGPDTRNSQSNTQKRLPAQNNGPLGQLKTRSLPARSNASPARAARPQSGAAPSAGPHQQAGRLGASQASQPPNALAPAPATPFHTGTQNDCTLHTIAAMTGWSEQQVVQTLGLTQQGLQHISAHGMQPQEFTQALTIANGSNNGAVHHRQGSASKLTTDLKTLPDGAQFALGIERNTGIGHMVTGKRVGNDLIVTDRQVGQTHTLSTPQDLQNYLTQSGAANLHVWYNQ